jgi:hypothetical protein
MKFRTGKDLPTNLPPSHAPAVVSPQARRRAKNGGGRPSGSSGRWNDGLSSLMINEAATPTRSAGSLEFACPGTILLPQLVPHPTTVTRALCDVGDRRQR